MTKPINCSNPSIPAYSGITINITNPTLNAAPLNACCPQNQPQQPTVTVESVGAPTENKLNTPSQYGMSEPIQNVGTSQTTEESTQKENILTKEKENPQDGLGQAYPPQYYLNNYNYIQNGEKGNIKPAESNAAQKTPQPESTDAAHDSGNTSGVQEEDMSSSQGIIEKLDSRVQEQKDLEKNGKQTRVIALTNEYIMSLENYLNNPNTEIRLMAAKEILTRLDEDKNRFDDAALNALLNKMLQDPEKLVRIAALSAFSSQLASGNDYTIQLLTRIQNDPNADKEDVLQAADSLLKMSSSTEIKYTPVQNNVAVQPQVEQQ